MRNQRNGSQLRKSQQFDFGATRTPLRSEQRWKCSLSNASIDASRLVTAHAAGKFERIWKAYVEKENVNGNH